MSDSHFTKIENKILSLGLDSFAVTAYVALATHRGQNSMGVFPSWKRISELTGQSRDRVWRSLKALRRANVIYWDRGAKARSNRYDLNPPGQWVATNSLYNRLKTVCNTDPCSLPNRLQIVCNTDTNHIHMNHIQLTSNSPTAEGPETGSSEVARQSMEKIMTSLKRMPGSKDD